MENVKRSVHYWCDDTINKKITGKGIGIAVLDSGIAAHPDFSGRIIAFEDCLAQRAGIYDDSGHGTHVTGILAGSGRMSQGIYAGMAPQADIISVKVLNDKGEGSVGDILTGIHWILRNRLKYHINVVNLSVGAKPGLGEEKDEKLIEAVEELWDAGIIVVASAGNYGPGEGTIAVPGTSRKIITVGLLDDIFPVRNRGEAVENYSGCGPTKSCVIKPDVTAPGFRVASCSHQYSRPNRYYMRKSGTSMATPVVAGALALLLEKYPDVSNVEGKLALRGTCEKKKQNDQGWGVLRVDSLLETL